MKKWIYSCLFLLVGVSQALCQDKKTETRNLASFHTVDVSRGVDAYLEKGSKTGVRLEVTNGSLSDVVTEVSGGTLNVEIEREGFKVLYNKGVKVKAYITYVNLEGVEVSSSASIFSSKAIKTSTFSVEVSSSGSVEVPLDVDKIFIDASSAGGVILTGKADYVDVDASSAADVNARRLSCKRANVSASSAANVKINATGELKAKASSGATVRYWGEAKKTNVQSSSGGRLKKED